MARRVRKAAVARGSVSGSPAPSSIVTPDSPTYVDPGGDIYGNPTGKLVFDPRVQIGRSGLKQYAGFIVDDFLSILHGAQAAKIFREILDNSALVSGINRQIQLSMRQVERRVEPFDDSNAEDVERAERIDQAFEDMSDSWPDMVTEFCSMVPYGYAPMEITWKVCRGWSDDPVTRSRYDDGAMMPRKIALRAQDTLFRWMFDDEGGVKAMVQIPPPDFRVRVIPIEKLLIFRPSFEKGNPEGYSVLRAAYFDWIFVKRLTEFEAIMGERQATGVPVVWCPAENLVQNPTDKQRAAKTFAQRTAQNVRVDDQMGIVMPLAYDEKGNKTWDITLLSEGRATQFDYDKVITRHEVRMAMCLLAGAAMLGHDKVGSFALAGTKWETELAMGLNAWLDSIYAVLNRHLLPRIYENNGWPMDRMCKVAHGDVADEDIDKLADAAMKLSQAGMQLFPDEELENHIRAVGGWPDRPETFDGDLVPGQEGATPQVGQETEDDQANDQQDNQPQDASQMEPGGDAAPAPAKTAKRVQPTYRPASPRISQALSQLAMRPSMGPRDEVAHGWTTATDLPMPAGRNWREDVEAAPVRRVKIRSLIATQPTVRRNHVRAFLETPNVVAPGQRSLSGELVDLPVVIRQGGKDHVADGHHRLDAMKLMGYRETNARVIEYEPDQGTPYNVGAVQAKGTPSVGAVHVDGTSEEDATKTPPWKVEHRGDEWVVVGVENGKVYGTHPTKEKAEAHMRALYANVPEARR